MNEKQYTVIFEYLTTELRSEKLGWIDWRILAHKYADVSFA